MSRFNSPLGILDKKGQDSGFLESLEVGKEWGIQCGIIFSRSTSSKTTRLVCYSYFLSFLEGSSVVNIQMGHALQNAEKIWIQYVVIFLFLKRFYVWNQSLFSSQHISQIVQKQLGSCMSIVGLQFLAQSCILGNTSQDL